MRVLFSATSGDGHLLPLLPLARAFAARGDEVAVAEADALASRVSAAGLRHVRAGPRREGLEQRFAPLRLAALELDPAERRARNFSERFGLIEAPERLPDLIRIVAERRPDLVVHESADLAAPIAAAAAGVPAANHSFGRAIPERALRRAAELVAPLWEEHGLEPDPLAGAYTGTYLTIVPPSLQNTPSTARMQPLRPAETSPRVGRDRPLVYVTLGTVFNEVNTLRTLLGGLALVDCDVLATTGQDVDPAELGPLPSNATVERYVPQDEVLPSCTATVAHGGSGSLLAALAYGLPLVLVPRGADQFENAEAAAASGVAVVVRPQELTAQRVHEAASLVLAEPGYAERARAIAAEIAEMPAPAAVAEVLSAAGSGKKAG